MRVDRRSTWGGTGGSVVTPLANPALKTSGKDPCPGSPNHGKQGDGARGTVALLQKDYGRPLPEAWDRGGADHLGPQGGEGSPERVGESQKKVPCPAIWTRCSSSHLLGSLAKFVRARLKVEVARLVTRKVLEKLCKPSTVRKDRGCLPLAGPLLALLLYTVSRVNLCSGHFLGDCMRSSRSARFLTQARVASEESAVFSFHLCKHRKRCCFCLVAMRSSTQTLASLGASRSRCGSSGAKALTRRRERAMLDCS